MDLLGRAMSPAFFLPKFIFLSYVQLMLLSELDYELPPDLIATKPVRPSRVLWTAEQSPQEIALTDLKKMFQPGDVLVINDTQVLKRRIFTEQNLEILFLSSVDGKTWDVLFPAKSLKVGDEISLPLGKKMKLIEKGRPQKLFSDEVLEEDYFQAVAELPLPPYIQDARGTRKPVAEDQIWYQTAWAEKPGSLAAPTASLHFSKNDLQDLENSGVEIHRITLHVGLGTFLPVKTENLKDHSMHKEWVQIHPAVWQRIQLAKEKGSSVWAMGTTVVRSLESAALGMLPGLQGETDLMITPGFQFQIVDRLLTNFHQPKSTLLALVYAFAGKENVLKGYEFAKSQKMRFLSYGDLSVWEKSR
jgi:S-adenosylmethionine:tRNA ribosyltransferase-isomerase